MIYLNVMLLWCASSFVALVSLAILGEYNLIYLVHFFTGLGIILLFGFFEAIKKDRELRKR